jgi:SNARE domain
MRGQRRANAQNALREVARRNEQIRMIEQRLIELAQMFQDLDELVIQQEVAVQNIEQQTEQVEGNVDRANVHLGGAITSADAARKKKWICLGIAGKFSYPQTSIPHLTFYSTHRHHHRCCGRGGGVALAEVKHSISVSVRMII